VTQPIPSRYQARIALLEEARDKLQNSLDDPHEDRAHDPALRKQISRLMPTARQVVEEAGIQTAMAVRAPAVAGGGTFGLNPFITPFEDCFGTPLAVALVDLMDQAIGVYAQLRDDTGLIHLPSRSGLDIESALERALRPSFRSNAPSSEREVQDAVEVILQSLGVEYSRETEVAPVGAKGFRPDFVVSRLELAIEVKLASETHPEKAVQEELAADISAYRTKWRNLLAVVYDLGVISDPYRLRRENMKHFGVSVVIVKH
jgi:hypothetical protein